MLHPSGDHYVWLIWASAFLLPWLVLFLSFPHHRRTMWRASILTTPFGLIEPIFVPEYWNPPSLFNLAQRTGFDVESLIFCFALGGVGVSFYNIVTGRMADGELVKHQAWHRYHGAALLVPVVAFPLLMLASWNPIYPAIVALLLGALGTIACRPDLIRNTATGGTIFLAYYFAFMLGLEWSVPGYIARVWNLGDLSGVVFLRVPLEELLFGFAFGAYWSGIYEHLTWRRSVNVSDRADIRRA